MKKVFKDLQEYLHKNIESYYYEDFEGDQYFDEEILFGLIAAFAAEFEKKLN